MKQALRALIPALTCGLLLLAAGGCGGGNSDTTVPPPVQSAAKRAFVVNQFEAQVDVINSQTDVDTGSRLQINGQSDSIYVMSNKKSLVHNSTGSMVLLDNPTETTLGTVNNFPGATDSIVTSPDGLFAYAAIPSLGKVAQMDLTTQLVTYIPADPALLPGVRHIAITKNGKTILAFSDNNNTVSFIDRTAANAITATVGGFDRPYAAVFSSDDSTGYVLNCGRECGGTSAGVAVVNMTTQTISRTVTVRAATIAVLDAANLYVAGTDVVANVGRMDVMNLSTFAVTAVTAPISDGLHNTMALAANNKVYVGSKACTNAGGNCLSVLNISAGTAAIVTGTATTPVPQGDVTAVTPITGRSVVYVIQNGQLVIYDTSTDLPQATQPFILGRVVDVKEVDN